MNTHIFNNARYALVAAILITALGVMSFFAFEPTMGWAQSNPHDFIVTQTITNEVSFLVEANDVNMVGSIAGITGGFATGTTRVSVNTNNPSGYTMTLAFATNTVMHSMVASGTDPSSDYISDYTPAGGFNSADYNWVTNPSGGSAEFGYTVRASTTNEVASLFLSSASTCGSGSEEENKCWAAPSSTARTIINSSAPNPSSTTTIKFKVAVPSNPSPALPAGVYAATGTLTATTNP